MTAPYIVLFDLDGTLVDTEPAAALAVRSCFKDWSLAIADEDASYITGRTWQSAFDYLFARYPLPLPAKDAADQMIGRYRESLETHLRIVPGAEAAVRSLAAAGIPLGLVSGSYRSEILWALRKLQIDQHFSVILGAEDYPRSKPAPDGYLQGLKALDRDASECVIFEDSQAGIASGRDAGAWVIAITGTNHFKQDTSRAHHHIADLTDVTANSLATLLQSLRTTARPG